jgi:diguanylate cyclase (GGDEF)-like protein/PAS domain S-box-containing protein
MTKPENSPSANSDFFQPLGEIMSEHKFSKSDLRTIINTSPVGMLLVDGKGIIKFSNHKSQTIFAYPEKELFDLPIDCLVPVRHQDKHSEKVQSYMVNRHPMAMGAGRVLPAVMKDGIETLVEIGLVPIEIRGHEFILASIIEASNKVLSVAAHHDSLTGLPNRNLFLELSENLRNLAIRNQANLTVMFVDLDWFKQVNDEYGHDTGDLVLVEVARILHTNIRSNDVVGRLGGDEFLICMYDTGDEDSIKECTNNLINQISEMKKINGHSINISASIGAITSNNPTINYLDEMIKQADQLMYKVKKSCKGQSICQTTNDV